MAQLGVDTLCLQVLRALIHNEERKLPAAAGKNTESRKYREQYDRYAHGVKGHVSCE